MMRVRNFLVDELSEANLQLQAVHLQLAQVHYELVPCGARVTCSAGERLYR